MELDKHFMYLAAMTLPAYTDSGVTPFALERILERIKELEALDMGAHFDMTQPEGDILGHPEASEVFAACDELGVPVSLRISYHSLKACKASLDALSQRGWLSEIALKVSCEEIEKSGFFQSLLKLSPEIMRRLALEVDMLEATPATLDPLSKQILPHERRDTEIVLDAARTQALPRILLQVDPHADPFDVRYDRHLSAWRAELSGLLRIVRISFDVAAYRALQPHRIASFVRPNHGRAPVFIVSDKF